MVVTDNVSDIYVFGIHRCAGNFRNGSQTAGIHGFCQLIQISQILAERFIVSTDQDFIGNSPEENRRMVVVLGNQLSHLADGIVISFLARNKSGNKRNLCPQSKSGMVAQIIEILIMLIVSQTDGVGTQLFDDRHVFFVVCFGNCPAFVQTVLVAGNTV